MKYLGTLKNKDGLEVDVDGHLHSIAEVSNLQTNLDNIAKTLVATLPATIGWYRVATSAVGVTKNSGRFEIDWTASGNHGQVIFSAGIMYSFGITLNQTMYSNYASAGLTKARIVYHPTYTGNYAYVEIYNSTASAITVTCTGLGLMGWSLLPPSTVGSIPAGYSSVECVFVDGISTEGQLKSSVPTGAAPLVVASTTKVTNLNAELLDGIDSTGFATATHAHSTLTGLTSSIGELNLIDGLTANAAELNKLDGISPTMTVTELNNIENTTGPIQTQLDLKVEYKFVDNSVYIYKDCSSRRWSMSSTSGVICITLPFGFNSTMLDFEIEVFNYATLGSAIVRISAYSSTASWANYKAFVSDNTKVSSVRLAYDGTKCVILLGVLTTAWAYPAVCVREVIATHNGAVNDWSTGYSQTILYDEVGLTNIVTCAINKGLDADTLDGLSSAAIMPTSGGVGNLRWTKFPDGLIMQFGSVSTTSDVDGTIDVTVTMPIAMNLTNSYWHGSGYAEEFEWWGEQVNLRRVSASQVRFMVSGYNPSTVYNLKYQIVGY